MTLIDFTSVLIPEKIPDELEIRRNLQNPQELKTKTPDNLERGLAERKGFEPSIRFPV